MARFFTADLHLGHRNIARYEPGRAKVAGLDPLAGSADDETQARLDTFLIDRWNEVVGPEDEVWLLGDVVMGQLDRPSCGPSTTPCRSWSGRGWPAASRSWSPPTWPWWSPSPRTRSPTWTSRASTSSPTGPA